MTAAAAIGDARRLAGYGLAGAVVHDARSAADAEAAWEALGDEIILLVLTPEAHDTLAPRLAERRVVWAVIPS